MSRGMIGVTILGLCSMGLFVVAEDSIAPPAEPESVTFTPVKTEKGDLIQVTAGDVKFWVGSLWLAEPNKSSGEGLKAKNGSLTGWSPVHRDGESSSVKISGFSLFLHRMPQARVESRSKQKLSN